MALQGTELYAASISRLLLSIFAQGAGSGSVMSRRYQVSVSGLAMSTLLMTTTVSAFLRNGQGVRWQNIDLGFRDPPDRPRSVATSRS